MDLRELAESFPVSTIMAITIGLAVIAWVVLPIPLFIVVALLWVLVVGYLEHNGHLRN